MTSQIDDAKTYIVEVDDVLTPDHCREMIKRIDALKPSTAIINTASNAKVRTDVLKAQHNVPAEMFGQNLIGVNERIRCYRYKTGMRFALHADGAFVRNDQEMSFYSYLVYLNDDFEGGETKFFTEPEVVITSKTGGGLLFQHPLIHEGSEVKSGMKYVARTDMIYRK